MNNDDKLWTVARFPNGTWCTGGKPTDSDYAESWVTQVWAKDRTSAKKKGQGRYSREQKKSIKTLTEATNE